MQHVLVSDRTTVRTCAKRTQAFAPFTAAHCQRLNPSARGSVSVVCNAGGFGASNKKKVDTSTGVYVPLGNKKKRVNIKEELSEKPATPAKVAAPTPGNWKVVGDLSMFESDKVTKAVLLDNGKALMLYKIGEDVYCSDANSTAYQFPLSDAKILQLEAGPAVEVPFDGTLYDLKTGKVLKWCPNDGNMVRGLLHSLKRDSNPVNLKVYEVEVTASGSVKVKMNQQEYAAGAAASGSTSASSLPKPSYIML